MEILNLSKMPSKNIETLFQRQNMEGTFSPNQDMTKYIGNGGKLLGEQDSLVEIWTIIEESGLM